MTAGAKEAVAPEGRPVAESATSPANPATDETVTVNPAPPPGAAVADAGEPAIAKSGAGGGGGVIDRYAASASTRAEPNVSSGPGTPRSTPYGAQLRVDPRTARGMRQQEGCDAADRGCGDRRACSTRVQTEQVGRAHAHARCDDVRVRRRRLATGRGTAGARSVDRSSWAVAPTANASGLFEGLTLVPEPGPVFPAAKTRQNPRGAQAAEVVLELETAARRGERPGVVDDVGASSVAALRSGSSSHWYPRWIRLSVDEPWSSKILTAIHFASGAIPRAVPPASPPTITPVTQVPCPLASNGTEDARRWGRTSCSSRLGNGRRGLGDRRRRPNPCSPRRHPDHAGRAPTASARRPAPRPARPARRTPTGSLTHFGVRTHHSTSGRRRNSATTLSVALSATAFTTQRGTTSVDASLRLTHGEALPGAAAGWCSPSRGACSEPGCAATDDRREVR